MANMEIDKVLRDAGLKVTPPRCAILTALSDAKIPKSVQALAEIVADMDIVTIYRTLASFEKAGIVRRVDLRQDAAYYELAGNHHHHIVCVDCGMIEDFQVCDMDALTKKIAARAQKFKIVREHTLELFGQCTKCA